MWNFAMIAYTKLIQNMRCKTIAVWSQNHTKHTNTLRGQNVGLLNVKPGGIYSDHWDLKGSSQRRLNQEKRHDQGIPRTRTSRCCNLSIYRSDRYTALQIARTATGPRVESATGRRRVPSPAAPRGSLSHTASCRLSAPALTNITPIRTPT